MTSTINELIGPQDTSGISRAQVERLLYLQKDILEAVVLGTDHQVSLNQLCSTAETMLPNSAASVMLFDEAHNHLDVRAAPSIPEPAIEALNGLILRPGGGSRGNAFFQNEPVFVSDTYTDARWRNLRHIAHTFHICTCWSMPIRSAGNKTIGSFALSSFESREPIKFHIRLLETCAHLSSIVLKRQQEEQTLWHIAHHDGLTNLPNRMLLNLRLEHAIKQAQRKKTRLGLLFIDLDNFKNINDSMGHNAGDKVLNQVARRISDCIRDCDTLARLGSDEFVLLIDGLETIRDIRYVVEKIQSAFETPIRTIEKDYRLTVSIGISLFPDDGAHPEILLQAADTAMYEAKSQGRNRFVFYAPVFTHAVQSRISMEEDLCQAIDGERLVLHYQPQFLLPEKRLVAAEVLVRWPHPDKGFIPPREFIPVAEDIGLITRLGQWVADTACRQANAWWDAGLPRFSVAINVSVKQLYPGCSSELGDLLRKLNFDPRYLELEITESLLMEQVSEAMDELRKMRKLGIRLAMDDFGTGHSSLAQLKNLPISKLKIDRSFVRDIPDDASDMVIARTIIAMGHSLGLKVVAEGVESPHQMVFLQDEGCDLVQGDLPGRPQSSAEFEAMLRRLPT